MNFEEIRRRNGVGVGAGSSTQGNTNTPLARRTSTLASTSNTSGEVGKILGKDDKDPSFGDIRNQYVTGEYNPNVSNVSGTKSVTVDSAYINSYFTDFNSFIQAAQNDYKNKMGWGTAAGLYDTYTPQWEDLRTRSGYITSYLENNKAHLDPTMYEELYNLVGESRSAGNSIVDGFEQNKDFYSKFGSQREYDTWWKRRGRESEFRALLSTDGFESWAERGRRDAENPTWEAAHAPLDILGWQPFGDGADIGNMVTFAEANKDRAKEDTAQALRTGGLPGQHTEAINLINNYMTEEEKGIYNYYIGRGEKDKADDYLNFMMDIFREREGGKIAALVDNTPLELVFSIGAGLQKPFNGLGNIDNFLMGKEADPTTSLQYASGEMSKNNEGIWKVANDLLNTTANMLPSILVGTLTGGTGGAIMMGVTTGGNAYAEMRNLGYDDGQARAYAVLTGASETMLSSILGGISSLGGGGGGIAQSLAAKLVPKVDNALARVAIRLGGNMIDEGLEEAIQEVLDPIFMAGATGENFEGIDIDAVLYSGLLGALSAGLIEGPGTTIDGKNAKDIYGGDVQALVTEALEIDPENPLALKAQAKLDAGKELSGFTLSELVKSNDGAIKNEYAKAAVEEALKQNPDNAYALRLQKKLDAGKSITEEQLNKLAKTTKTEEGKKNAEKYAKTEELLESDALEKGLENAGTIAGATVNGVKNAFDDAASGAEGAVKNAVSGVVSNVSSSVEGMLGLAENTFDEVTKNLWGGISNLWGGLSGIGQNAQRAVENGVNAAKDAVGGTIDGAKDAAGNAVSATVDKVKSAVESELSALGEAGERASEIADVIAKKLRGIDLSEAEQRLFDASDAAKQAFVNLGGEISESVGNAVDKVGETVTSIKDKVKDTLDSLGEVRDVPKLTDIITKKLQGIDLTEAEEKIFSVSDYGKQAFESLKAEIGESVEGAKDKAESVVDGIKDAVSGVTDKATAENATDSEVSTESKNSASETTTETNTTTDTEVTVEQEGVATDTKVESIESITESGVNLKLQNDTIVNSNDVSFKNTDVGLIYQAVTDMTTRVGGFNIDTANTFVKGYTPDLGITAGEYIHGWSDAYRFGAKGFPASELITGTFTSRLPAKLRNTAYNFGKAFGNDAISKSITPSITKPTVSYQTITRRQGSVVLPKGVSIETLTPMQRDSIKGLEVVSQALGKKIHLFESELVNGKRQGANGWYDPETGDIHLDIHAGVDGRGAMLFTGSHELTHDLRVRNPQGFKRYADAVLDSYVKHFGKDGLTIEGLIREKLKHLERNGRLEGKTEEEAYDLAYAEVIADSAESMLTDSKAFEEFSKRIQKEDKSLWNKIKKFFSDLVKKIKAAYEGVDPDSVEGKLLREMGKDAERLQKIWVDALMEAADSDIVSDVSGESDLVQIDADTESVAPLYSERTWTESEYVTERDKTAKNIAKALGVSLQDAYKYIDDINGVARLIADDRVRLDYEPNLDEKATVLKPNSDYKYSVDMSTLCAKRLLFTGTFDAIQRALPNTVFDSEDIVALREMMQKRGYEVACGICYVESTRREIGRITQDFINGYKEAQKTGKPIQRINSDGKAVDLKKTKDQMETTADKSTDKFFAEKGYTPTLADLNTTDIDFVKRDHPLVYEAYLNFMNARGQAKPKLLETRAEYKGEILNHFKAKNAVKARNDAGGLRLQSFSDFEVPHMIDMMQIVMDMSRVGLKSQAYTKVPAFAEVFGDTGVKINLSLIAKGDGLDSKGNLVFDDVEGINHKEAFALRDKYSKNVGTILVGKTDAHIIAAMADPRIDYIIPFHKSSWKESLYDALGLTGYADYTDTQNEKPIDKDRKIKNFDPSEYWDFTKSGDENAQIYLDRCRKDGRIPKFPQFQGYPGYWKLLIDFKMYDNDGVGSPEEVVKPVFNTEASERILNEYEGGHKSFPVAKDVVEDFVKEHKSEVKYSDRNPYSYEGQVFYSDRVTDKKTLDFLENQKHVTVYRAMQVIDGELYPPMAARVKSDDGKKSLVTPSKIGAWEQAVERPDLIRNGNKFELDKANGSSIQAAYNPYFHTSASPLNDQFSSAYKRPNLVIVEGEIPESELTSGYRAEFAKDTVGETKWHSGPVASKLKGDKARRVFLSRWFKPVRIVPDSEVASIVAKTLEGESIDVPYNVVTPTLRAELEKVGVPIKYQDRGTDSYSNRSLLANALEGVVQNDIERDKLQQYKEKIDLLNAEEQRLLDLRAKIKELSFAKGTRDTEAIKKLQLEATKAANRVNIYDKQLLNLESTKALKGVLEREKALARKKAEQRGKETLQRYRERAAQTQRELMDRYQESRRRGVESRNKTAMRHKIKDVVNDLNNYLLKGTKDKHVPIELQKAVAEALDAVNMDTVGAEERIAKKRAEMMSAKTPEAVERLAKEIEHIQEMGGNMEAKLSRLKTAYDSIINSEDTIVAGSHDEVISSTIEKVMEFVGDTPLRDMSLPQLEAVYDMYRMVLHSIRAANKAFKAKKSEEISVIANRVMEEIGKQGKQKKLQTKAGEALSTFDWNNQKPVYAFERIGSNTFTEVFDNVRSGEDTWARDMTEAKAFLEAQKRQHKYNAWSLDKTYSFTSSSGMKFKLNLPQIMSLYAYSKREQAAEHLKRGGIVFDETTEVTIKNKLGFPVKFNPTEATAYNISEETLADIISKLTPEQKAFADAMQDYLSTTMGEKGNEVSLQLYGVKLFKEKNYFPLKSATQFMAKAKEQQQGEAKIKNKGFTKETVYKANNPIVLTPFMDVWAGHVNEMSMYHAFTLALEDFYRVYNYKTPTSETMATESVEMFLQNAHGKAATKYIDQLLKDLNGGARSDPRENVAKSLMTNFKKASVIASASVVIQQPSAIIRAQALVDAKYFAGISGKKHSDTWAEVKKYAPVAVIKEMGYFDVGMGQSSTEWLKGEKTLKDKMDDALSKAPALADEYTWCAIWNAVKRETARKNPKLKTSSEEFLNLCGERFTEVIVKTQVYDSTLARSANMRSKSAFMNMLTAFMAEPTTSINMLVDAFKKGNKKQIARTMGAVYGSVILNSALVSLVYAMRDDDEDETFLEKYLSRLTTEVIDGINPLTYLPFVKDIWSAAQGFDVERADMTLITKTLDSLQQLIKVAGKDRSDMSAEELGEHNKAVNEAVLTITDNLSSLTGIPVKNIRRDINAVINGFKTIKTDMEGRETTGGSLADNILEDVKDSLPVVGWLPGDSKGDKLYRAIVSGDMAYAERLKSGYTSEASYNSAIRKALRENDPRIKEAAVARYNGDIAEYMRIAKSIIAEGHFKQDDVVAAINSEINAMKPDEGGSTSSDKAVSLYKIEDYYAALDESSFVANTVKEDMIAVEVVNGKDRDEAETSFYSKFVSHIRDMYDKGEINDYKAKDMLVRYGDKSEEEAASKVQYWSFKKEYPDYDLSESAVSKYYSDVKPSGISIEVFCDYSKQRSKAEGVDLNGDGKTDSGSVKREVLQIINSLPISRYQKNVLYYLNGWSQSTISEAPWY